jgi:hypothetical protein
MTGLMQIGGRLGSLGRLASYETETPPPDADNFATFRNVSGSTITNYPLRFGRIFAEGEIADYPQILVDGTPITTQADVKTRWDDDSVKHCIFSAIIASAANNTDLELTFQNQGSGNNTALTKAEMQHADFDFNVGLSMTVGGTPNTASALDMLDNDDYTVWCSGQIATTIILCDHATGAYDMDWGGSVPIRPIFQATFWNASKRVEIAAIVEQSDAEHLGDITTSTLTITKGDASPTTAYTKGTSTVTYLGTSWVKRFWIGTAPTAAVNFDHNLAYLASTMAFPNYDTSIVVDSTALTDMYSDWTGASKDLYDAGLWNKTMSAAGGRDDIGPLPTWTVMWLYTGDYRMREVVLGHADLHGAPQARFRETATGKRLQRSEGAGSTGLGLPISATDRKTTSIPSGFSYGSTDVGDRLKVVGSNAASGWTFVLSHQPETYAAAYALTGDHYYKEQMQFWACTSVHYTNGANTLVGGRGPTGAEGGIDQASLNGTRVYGWAGRNRMLACYWTPDSEAMKDYLSTMVDDMLGKFEGIYNITTGTYNSNTQWDWANAAAITAGSDPGSHLTNALHFMEKNSGIGTGEFIPPAGGGASPWMHNFCIYGFGIGKELGFSTDAVLEWLAVNLIGMVNDAPNPYMCAVYQQPTGPSGNATFLQTWQDVYDLSPSTGDNGQDLDSIGVGTAGAITDLNHDYGLIATCAASFVTEFTGGATAQAWLETERDSVIVDPELNPKWMILPRS